MSDKPTDLSEVSRDIPAPEPDAVRLQMDRILGFPEFRATTAQRAFLQFVVDKVLAGEANEIKGYTVATQVFGRGADFDQATDPIVSIQANKLRRALEHYYLTAGASDPIRVDIPKGTYVPVFRPRDTAPSETVMQRQTADDGDGEPAWPTLLVRPFHNRTGDPELDYLGMGLATDLAMEITRYQEVRVILMQSPDAGQRRASDTAARFVIDGTLQKDGSGVRISVALVDMTTGIQIWGDVHQSAFDADGLISFQEDIARTVAGKITCEAGIISRTLAVESKHKPPNALKTYEAILRYYEFNAMFTAGTFFRAFEALQFASEKEPECGLVWSMLARLYAVNYSLELFDLDTPIETALSYATRGVHLEPASQRARLILAFVLLFQNDISQGLVEVENCYRLNPNSLVLLENIGYMMTLLGDWTRGPALIRRAMSANPYYNIVAHYPLWVDSIRTGDDRQALRETLCFRNPQLFWDPLMKAAVLGLLGRSDDGREAVESLLALKPDFRDRGRTLIEHYIKFEAIVDRTIEGLANAGIELA